MEIWERTVQIAALIVAAGRGSRARSSGSEQVPKQYAMAGGATVLTRALAPFLDHPQIGCTLVVVHPDDLELYHRALPATHPKLLEPCFGGTTRQISVFRGLEQLARHGPDCVLIHDGVRPFVDRALIDRVLAGLQTAPAVVAATPVTDTLKLADTDAHVLRTVPREGLWRVQTPQGFRFAQIHAAHRAAAEAGSTDFTDDAAVAEWHGMTVTLVPGSERNRKVTTLEDVEMAARELSREPPGRVVEVRSGTGFDVHQLIQGDAVWLCGVRIPHTHRLLGHSDADVGLHALTDALLGAIGDGDIGQHFPPSEERWRNAASHLFLADAARRVAALGGAITNVDVTLLCEAPKIAPHRDVMRARIAEILGIDVARVAVKATTTEGLGFTGRREGIAAMATATVTLPAPASHGISRAPRD
jgi:2-C-methyl-D-erythritol 4-phosphate cytidylyltransferase/2-C-methyl-D-erythritol 2,4-cyclodiphosphate synthase